MKPVFVLIETATDEFWHPLGHNGKRKYVKRGIQAYTSPKKALSSAMKFHPTPDPETITVQEYTPFNNVEVADWGVKYAISQFLQMNIENPAAPVNIDEVKRRAMEDVRRRYDT